MNRRKAAFGFCITLGMIIGGVLGIVTGALLLGTLLVGAILGALGFLAIDGVVSRRRTSILPYDQLQEHHQVSNPGHHQTSEAQLTQIQDGHIDQYMPFLHGKPR